MSHPVGRLDANQGMMGQTRFRDCVYDFSKWRVRDRFDAPQVLRKIAGGRIAKGMLYAFVAPTIPASHGS